MNPSTVNVVYLNIKQAAERLGISKRAFRSLIKNPINPIPHFRIGSSGRIVRIKIGDLDSWLENFRVKTSDDNISKIIKGLFDN
jgi:excisionase family DNA binding protein